MPSAEFWANPAKSDSPGPDFPNKNPKIPGCHGNGSLEFCLQTRWKMEIKSFKIPVYSWFLELSRNIPHSHRSQGKEGRILPEWECVFPKFLHPISSLNHGDPRLFCQFQPGGSFPRKRRSRGGGKKKMGSFRHGKVWECEYFGCSRRSRYPWNIGNEVGPPLENQILPRFLKNLGDAERWE